VDTEVYIGISRMFAGRKERKKEKDFG